MHESDDWACTLEKWERKGCYGSGAAGAEAGRAESAIAMPRELQPLPSPRVRPGQGDPTSFYWQRKLFEKF